MKGRIPGAAMENGAKRRFFLGDQNMCYSGSCEFFVMCWVSHVLGETSHFKWTNRVNNLPMVFCFLELKKIGGSSVDGSICPRRILGGFK